jgi:hypothetical protein
MKYLLYALCFTGICCSCKKYLDAKPDQKLQLPNTVSNVQALLDNEVTIVNSNPATGEASADNYYLTDANLAALSSMAQRNTYTWEDDITLAEYPNHWSRVYDIVTIGNVALESIDKIIPAASEQQQWNNVKGSALFLRARAFLMGLGLWAKAYDKTTAGSDLGIPLRLNSDYLAVTTRSSIQEGYERILADLKEAAPLLPLFPQHPSRPSRTAAFGMLARAYLCMGIYDSAGLYADKCLAINSTLLNYNNLNAAATYPLAQYNSEVIMHSLLSTPAMLSNTRALVDSALYKTYGASDLRKTIFFKTVGTSTYSFRGSYNGSSTLFNGITTDEQYLIKAECLARQGSTAAALATLNSLMITRWKTGTFVPFTAADANAALGIILTERRKELIFRDLRWTDLKRLNREPLWQQSISRRITGKDYILPPGDNRYALPIPASVINISGITQNPR